MTPHKFIPPKDNDEDFNPMIDDMIEREREMGYPTDEDLDIRDSYEDDSDSVDDIKYVL